MLINGSDLMLFVGGKSIAFATSHSIDISMETKQVAHKDIGGGHFSVAEPGLASWTVSSENLIGDPMAGIGFDELFEMMVARTPVTGVFALEGDSTDFNVNKLDAAPTAGWKAKANDGYTGEMLITSLSKSAPNGEYATMSVTFTGTGPLTKIKAGKMSAPAVQTASTSSK